MKTLKSSARCLLVLWVVLGLGVPVVATAQAQPTIHIHNLTGPDEITDPSGLPALRVTIDFTLVNNSGEVMSGIGLASATVDLEDGSRNPSPVTDVTEPWSVVIVLDNSRTLFVAGANNAFKAARDDAINAVGALPDGTNISVITVSEAISITQDFTTKKEDVQNIILRQWKPVNVQLSQMYDGAMQALSELERAPGRRALIILTASANTSATLAQQVVERANQNNVQIYGVGIRGFAAVPAELQALAGPTGGLVDTRDAADINFAFANITNALNLQRRATTVLYPLAGPHEATLSLVLPDNSVIKSQPQVIVSPRDFDAPPTLTILGEVIFKNDNLQVNLALTSPALVQRMEANVIDTLTGSPIIEGFRLSTTQGQIQIPVGKLPEGQKFILEIRTFGADQAPLAAAAQKEFTVTAVVPILAITKIDLPQDDAENPAVVVTLQRFNLDDVIKYEVSLLPNGTVVPVPGTVAIVPLADTVSIPVIDGLPTGAYQVRVAPLAADNTVLAEAAISEQFQFVAPDPRAIFFRNLADNPTAIAGISLATGLGCVGFLIIIFFVISAARPKQARLPKSVDLALPDVKRRAPPPVMESGSMRGPPSEEARPAARPSAPRRPAADRPPANRPPADRPPPPRSRDDGPAASGVRSRASVPAAPASAASVGMPTACLSSHTPPELRLSGRISKTPFAIGRAAGNDMVVQVDNRVGVSGKHASVVFDKGRFWLIDLQSTYGTTLNDQRLPPNTPTPLDEGALIGLGPKIKVKFSLQDCA